MNLTDELHQSLAKLAGFSTGQQLVEITHSSGQLRCQLVALDSLACSFTRLALSTDSLRDKPADGLRDVAERLAGRLTYLLEPISPIETDAEGCVVQMRSNPPHKDTDRTSYYELLVSRSGELSLCRYSRTAGSQRELIPAHLTREVLGRLVGDFAAVVG